jgi:hypothetical protein
MVGRPLLERFLVVGRESELVGVEEVAVLASLVVGRVLLGILRMVRGDRAMRSWWALLGRDDNVQFRGRGIAALSKSLRFHLSSG